MTGVQTCALPISGYNAYFNTSLLCADCDKSVYIEFGNGASGNLTIEGFTNGSGIEPTLSSLTVAEGAVITATIRDEDRSEERRVGKECRSRWSPYH